MTTSERADGRPAGDGRAEPAVEPDDEAAPWHRRRWTTIVLEEYGDGWRATQTGVAAEGHGDTAADAAAAYCRRIAETGETEGDATGRDASGPDGPPNGRGGRDG
ncbi:hypothetical protein [Halosimplex marinum]|uniref:hypothetical protein n=1 Tax=Halosimplex marinum TaxID=3396620 RepID=UPI003F57610D